MNAADMQILRRIEAEQIRLFRQFMAYPDKRKGIIKQLAALLKEQHAITGEQPYTPPEPVKHQHKSGRMTNPARAAHFQKGRA